MTITFEIPDCEMKSRAVDALHDAIRDMAHKYSEMAEYYKEEQGKTSEKKLSANRKKSYVRFMERKAAESEQVENILFDICESVWEQAKRQTVPEIYSRED